MDDGFARFLDGDRHSRRAGRDGHTALVKRLSDLLSLALVLGKTSSRAVPSGATHSSTISFGMVVMLTGPACSASRNSSSSVSRPGTSAVTPPADA